VGYPLREGMGEMQSARFEIKKTYQALEMLYHRFFVLEKSGG